MVTQLYINNTLVDLPNDFSITLNKAIADIAEPENRHSDFSKTVVIPGSKGNNKLFGHIFDISQSILNESDTVNFFPDFNPNLKASCHVYVDSLLQLSGYAYLHQINITHENNIEYEISIVGELGNLFVSVGSKKLSDLDFSRYNHLLNRGNIENSWNIDIKDTHGAFGVSPFQLGRGYVYPLIDYGFTDAVKQYKVQDFRPALYAKTVVDAIFDSAGYTYTSDSFFNSDLFKHLIIPYTGTGIQTHDVGRIVQLSTQTGTTHNIAISGTVKYDIANGAGSFQYNSGTGELTVATGNSGYYYLKGFFAIISHDFSSLVQSYNLVFEVNGAARFNYYVSWPPISTLRDFDLGWVYLQQGDIIRWRLSFVTDSGGTYTSGHTIDIQGGFSITPQQGYIPSAGPIDMNEILSPDILQKDFMVSISRIFNLYWDSTDLANQMKVQTRDDYGTNNILIWEKKLDISKNNPVNILPMGALDANPYYFTYKPGEDYFNKLYQEQFKRTYGDYYYYVNNDFVRTEKKIEVIFTASPLVNLPEWNTDMVLTSFRSYDSKGVASYNGGNIRLLYYAGLLTTSSGFTIDDNGSLFGYAGYPYAGHLDDPYNSTLDLSFGTPQKIFFGQVGGTVTYSGNNLFNVYYQSFINEITNKDSKIVQAWFRLRAHDVNKIDFSYLYYFMGQYFRLNKVIDHEIGKEILTQCEFIKSNVGTLVEPAPPPPGPTGIGIMIIESTFIIG